MFSDENNSSSLAKLLNSFDFVIMDTCSLMEESFPNFMDILVNAKDYLREDVRITVYHKCLDELKKHSKNKVNDDLRIAAKRALKILKKTKKYKIFELTKKEKDQNFADNVIYVSASQMRITKKVLVITQDKKLADDLGKLNFLDSQKGRKVATYKLLSTGILDVNRGEKGKRSSFRQEQRVGGTQHPAKPPKKDNQNDLMAKAKAHDDNLWSLLHNPNCPSKRKKDDISAQLSLLEKLSEDSKKRLNLRYSQAALKEELLKADAPIEPKKSETPKEALVKKAGENQAKPTVQEKKAESKPAEQKPSETPQIRGFYGNGNTLEAAIVDAARYQGILFRDPSVEYIPQIHGGMNLTSLDLSAVVKMVQQSSESGITYKERLFVKPEKAIKGFRVSLALLKETPKIAPAKEEKPAEAEKPIKKKDAPKVKTKPKKADEKPADAPVHGTLVVAVPDDEKTKAAIERKVKKTASAEPKKKEKVSEPEKPAPLKKAKTKQENTQEKKGEEKPKTEPKKAASAKKKKADAAPSAKAEPAKKVAKAVKEEPSSKPAPKKEEAKKQGVKPKGVKAQKKPKEPEPKKAAKPTPKKKAPEENKAAKPAEPTPFEKAQKAEARLLSVLSNGNYPKESKLADLKAQLDLVRALKPEEVSKLKYNADALKGMIGLMS